MGAQMEWEEAYSITSLPPDAPRLLHVIRSHWVLDMTFGEDAARIRTGDSPQNMAVLRHLALKILKRQSTPEALQSCSGSHISTVIARVSSMQSPYRIMSCGLKTQEGYV